MSALLCSDQRVPEQGRSNQLVDGDHGDDHRGRGIAPDGESLSYDVGQAQGDSRLCQEAHPRVVPDCGWVSRRNRSEVGAGDERDGSGADDDRRDPPHLPEDEDVQIGACDREKEGIEGKGVYLQSLQEMVSAIREVLHEEARGHRHQDRLQVEEVTQDHRHEGDAQHEEDRVGSNLPQIPSDPPAQAQTHCQRSQDLHQHLCHGGEVESTGRIDDCHGRGNHHCDQDEDDDVLQHRDPEHGVRQYPAGLLLGDDGDGSGGGVRHGHQAEEEGHGQGDLGWLSIQEPHQVSGQEDEQGDHREDDRDLSGGDETDALQPTPDRVDPQLSSSREGDERQGDAVHETEIDYDLLGDDPQDVGAHQNPDHQVSGDLRQ